MPRYLRLDVICMLILQEAFKDILVHLTGSSHFTTFKSGSLKRVCYSQTTSSSICPENSCLLMQKRVKCALL